MSRTFLLAAAFLFCGGPVRAQSPMAKPLADFDRLVSQLKTANAVGEPVRSGDTTVIPFAAIRFGLGAGGASTMFGGGGTAATGKGGFWMSGETRPLGFVVSSERTMGHSLDVVASLPLEFAAPAAQHFGVWRSADPSRFVKPILELKTDIRI